MKILYVEDSETTVHNTARIARHMGHELVAAGTGAEGRRLIASENPDLILLDLHLPDAFGLNLAKEWRAQNYTMPIVVITGEYLTPRRIEQAREIGCNEILSKPIDPEDMEALIQRYSKS